MSRTKKSEIGKKVGIGAALVAVPLGSAMVFMHLKDASEQKNPSPRQDDRDTGRIDPAMMKYAQSGTIATGFKHAKAVAVDEAGRLLIAGDRKVRIFGADGGKGVVVVSEIEFSEYPTCVAGGADGTVIVGFRKHVEIFGADGKLVKKWATFGPKSQVTGLAVRGQNVFIADAGRRMVIKCDLDGKVQGELGQRDKARGQDGLVLPSAFLNVSLTADGQVLVNNPGMHRVETWNSDGEVQKFWGNAGAGLSSFIGCCNPSHLAVMADGRIITAEKGTARVKIYKPNGELDAVVAGPKELGGGGGGLNGFEVAADKENRILVLEPGGTEIRVFTLKEQSGGSGPQVARLN
ncbi:MAG: NHL repeat-containing protein [Phycisphaerales bacterium]|nr:NHL repeat-containing protein [Phycisphaerales bacterium]